LYEDDWTSEQLDIKKSLDKGDAAPLVKFLLRGERPYSGFKEYIMSRLISHDYVIKFEPRQASVGRPKSTQQNLFYEVELLHIKNCLIKKFGVRAGEAEHLIAKGLNSNFDYVTKRIRSGKQFLSFLEKNCHEYARPSDEEIVEKYPQLFNDI
jgi:hypothetical protein